jgi:acyl-CoA synthetase (AMP-forming)/AMP-acid ligase II
MRPPQWLVRTVANRLESKQLGAHHDAQRVQEKLLGTLLGRYRHTELGRTLGIDQVASASSYREKIPTRTASDYAPLWNRVLEENRPGLLHPKKLEYVCLSSGTSGCEKYIPCPEEQLANYRSFTNHAFFHGFHMLEDYSLMSEHGLITSAPPIKEVRPDGLVVGFGSGVATAKSSRFARQMVRPTLDILNIKDGKEKVRRTVEQAFTLDVRILTGIPLFVVALLEELLDYARELGKPVRCARDVWPNLRMYLYSGSPLALYEHKLRSLLGEGVTPYEVYSSTESPIAYQYRRDEPGLFVDLSAGYFEFEEPGSHKRIPIHEVELGVLYDIVVTTHAGAFAYKLGDRVQFLSKVPYLLRFAGRDREEINVGGEKVSLSEAHLALEGACADTQASMQHFFVCPGPVSGEQKNAHDWHVEFSRAPASATAWARAIDERLMQANSVYRLLRHDGLMASPRLTTLRPGTIERYVHGRSVFGQGKFLNLYNNREVAEQIARLAPSDDPGLRTRSAEP